MESIAKPLRRLQEEGSWFVRAKEIRLLWIVADSSSRSTALSLSERLEYHADNTSPFVVLDTPYGGADLGARARQTRFVERFAEKAEALKTAGLSAAAFEVSDAREASVSALARDLVRAKETLSAPLQGLVIVLAPPRVDDAEAFEANVRALVLAKALDAVRFIVVETDSQHLGAFVQELGPERALVVDLRVDEADQDNDLSALAGPAPSPNEPITLPYPWGAWSSGGAMPSAKPPRRVDDIPAPSDEQLAESGLSPLFVKGGGLLLQRLMLGAALALRKEQLGEAIDLQRRAAELCGVMNQHGEHVIQRMVLAGYLLAASTPNDARAEYERAASIAAEHELPAQHAQAVLGLAMLDTLEQRPSAITHYENAARLSESAGAAPLAIECWRMAGQGAHEAGAVERAITCWESALALVDKLAPEAARATSAADIARWLANAVAELGDAKSAQGLHRRAFQLEHGVEPDPVQPLPVGS